jgi:hypothetical protein
MVVSCCSLDMKTFTRYWKLRFALFAPILLLIGLYSTHAQSAPVVYQGRLSIAGAPANGNYDMQFKLFDNAVVSTGAQQGNTIATAAAVANGVFTVTLDFGAAAFTGAERHLEIGVKPAGSSAAFTILAPRQQITSVPYAIHSLSATQLDGRPASSFIQADSNGNVGIGTNVVAQSGRLQVNGNTRITPGGGIGYLQIGTPNGETGLSVLGKNRFDLRFNDQTLTLAANPGLGPANSRNGLSMNTNGNVGIGMDSPLRDSQWKLEINGPTRLTPSSDQTAIEFSKPNGETGMSILAKNRADVRFDGSTLKLVVGSGVGAPSAENGIAITTSGKVGIGTTSPNGKLHVENPENSAKAIYGGATGVGGIGVYGIAPGQSSVALYGAANENGSVAVWGENPKGIAIYAHGDASQARDKGGFVKAMIFVNEDGTIARCYNGMTDVSAGNCGFTITRDDPIRESSSRNVYRVDFGFPINDRFISVTPQSTYRGAGSANLAGANFLFLPSFSPNEVEVETFITDLTYTKAAAAASFMIVVY